MQLHTKHAELDLEYGNQKIQIDSITDAKRQLQKQQETLHAQQSKIIAENERLKRELFT